MRQILARQGGGLTHVTAIGAPEQVADQIETWVQAGAADGFNIMSAQLPDVAAEFVDHVVPILQRKGMFRTEYPGTTLRDTLGLERPGDGFENYVPSGERLHTAEWGGKVRGGRVRLTADAHRSMTVLETSPTSPPGADAAVAQDATRVPPPRDAGRWAGVAYQARYIAEKLFAAVVVLWLAATTAFVAVHLSPGDPVTLLMGEFDTPELRATIEAQWGLDKSLLAQYLDFLTRLVQGDFGMSYVQRAPVARHPVQPPARRQRPAHRRRHADRRRGGPGPVA